MKSYNINSIGILGMTALSRQFLKHTLAIFSICLLTLSLIGGCSQQKGVIFEPLETPLSWPQAPEVSRVFYVGSLSTDKDLKPAKSFTTSLSESIFGEESSQGLLTPYATCTDDKDRLFICDSNAQVIHVYNFKTRKYQQWRPDEINVVFSQPVGIAYDALNRLLVSDSRAGVIFVFNDQGQYLGTLGDGDLDKPTGIAVDRKTNRIYVADVGTHQILVLSFDGELLERIGSRGSELGQFNFPTSVAVGSDGSIYVCDSLNFRVQVFDPDHNPVRQVGGKGDLPGYFSLPKGVALDSAEHLYVIDSRFETVQVFKTTGELLMTFGQEGNGPGQFWLPTGIYIDHTDRIWIADSYNQRVQVFDYRPENLP